MRHTTVTFHSTATTDLILDVLTDKVRDIERGVITATNDDKMAYVEIIDVIRACEISEWPTAVVVLDEPQRITLTDELYDHVRDIDSGSTSYGDPEVSEIFHDALDALLHAARTARTAS